MKFDSESISTIWTLIIFVYSHIRSSGEAYLKWCFPSLTTHNIDRSKKRCNASKENLESSVFTFLQY